MSLFLAQPVWLSNPHPTANPRAHQSRQSTGGGHCISRVPNILRWLGWLFPTQKAEHDTRGGDGSRPCLRRHRALFCVSAPQITSGQVAFPPVISAENRCRSKRAPIFATPCFFLAPRAREPRLGATSIGSMQAPVKLLSAYTLLTYIRNPPCTGGAVPLPDPPPLGCSRGLFVADPVRSIPPELLRFVHPFSG